MVLQHLLHTPVKHLHGLCILHQQCQHPHPFQQLVKSGDVVQCRIEGVLIVSREWVDQIDYQVTCKPLRDFSTAGGKLV